MRIKIIAAKNLGWWAKARTPASPTIPMANPAAMPLNPTDSPAPSKVNDLFVCFVGGSRGKGDLTREWGPSLE